MSSVILSNVDGVLEMTANVQAMRSVLRLCVGKLRIALVSSRSFIFFEWESKKEG